MNNPVPDNNPDPFADDNEFVMVFYDPETGERKEI
jgi:hypothetical protein